MMDLAEDLPEPLTPNGCDMGRNDWYPMYFDRLRSSRWWRRASDLCRARNVMLWGEAYKEVPAGSLADNDDDLAEAAGFGFDVPAFLAVKAEIMAPWVKCSDGRWYHPTLCEVVIEAWERVSEKRRAERIKKANQRAAVQAKKSRVPSKVQPVPVETGPVPGGEANVPGDKGANPGGQTAQERKGQDRTVGSNEPVASAAPSATVRVTSWEVDPAFVALWDAAPKTMKVRAKSKAKVGLAWDKARKLAEPRVILEGFLTYLREDPDYNRPGGSTGGPGLHIWLNDRTWETWARSDGGELGATWPDARWSVAVDLWRAEGRWEERLGPKPGEPGCRAPAHLLISATQGAAA